MAASADNYHELRTGPTRHGNADQGIVLRVVRKRAAACEGWAERIHHLRNGPRGEIGTHGSRRLRIRETTRSEQGVQHGVIQRAPGIDTACGEFVVQPQHVVGRYAAGQLATQAKTQMLRWKIQ